MNYMIKNYIKTYGLNVHSMRSTVQQQFKDVSPASHNSQVLLRKNDVSNAQKYIVLHQNILKIRLTFQNTIKTIKSHLL